ncbi:phosphoenolpyruvate carboxylase [Gangjinia marincola]|uniref:Phosphoenolpyruvate carboxylase n=1 Tax=Gangjinia marincola TaxID=578463 RepID=A0ABN1MFB2_9FLAO
MNQPKSERFDEQVLSKYQIYNSIFITLPFDNIKNTGALLPLFSEHCQAGFAQDKNPTQIIDDFFEQYVQQASDKDKIGLLFRFIQYIERQVVLFDAIEDASFTTMNNMNGQGTLRNIKEQAQAQQKFDELNQYLQRFKTRTVLTAHPTQFYPGTVLGIITDLGNAIQENDLSTIKQLLAQLGKTPFFKDQKPTPYDEAVNLIWYLENIFYHAMSSIYSYIKQNISGEELQNQVINIGFWPGGDRDGNPFVTTQITLDVARRLRKTLLKNYYKDLRRLSRRITFEGVYESAKNLEATLYQHAFMDNDATPLSADSILSTLHEMKQMLVEKHQSLFVDKLQELINKVELFGMFFATLDIRQDSRVHHRVMEAIVSETTAAGKDIFPKDYLNTSEAEQIDILTKLKGSITAEEISDEMANKTLGSIYAMKQIQLENGEQGCNRYIISNNGSVLNVMEAFTFLRLCDWQKPTADVVPLFETVDDLDMADQVMETLYTNPAYAEHLKRRNNIQTIMLGFSDGTKDGGYFMANWGIFTAKERLTTISRKYNVEVLFFDGRGGPPARGGGKTHQFYASLGPTIEQKEVQLTIQGQTISSNFGTLDSCRYNLEQLISSGIVNELFTAKQQPLSKENRSTMNALAQKSYETYVDFKNHPCFLPYLQEMSTLKYYAKTNIGSRPSKRGKSDELVFSDLRAIPFVGSWSQLKQNVPGFYGVGTAIEAFEREDRFHEVQSLYDHSAFFRALIENSMMSLSKSYFKLTAYMKEDEKFGAFWTIIHEEYKRTKRLLLKLTGYSELMEDAPAMKASIAVREQIVLPLLTIQQYALREIQRLQTESGDHQAALEVYEKMVTRSLFGNINAARNSA